AGRNCECWGEREVTQSEGLPGGPAARPRPLEVIAAEPAGDVDGFADEEEPAHAARLHGLLGKRVGVDASGGDFSLGVPFRAAGREAPGFEPARRFAERGVADVADGAGAHGLAQY